MDLREMCEVVNWIQAAQIKVQWWSVFKYVDKPLVQ
jgi:hypothetical protein